MGPEALERVGEAKHGDAVDEGMHSGLHSEAVENRDRDRYRYRAWLNHGKWLVDSGAGISSQPLGRCLGPRAAQGEYHEATTLYRLQAQRHPGARDKHTRTIGTRPGGHPRTGSGSGIRFRKGDKDAGNRAVLRDFLTRPRVRVVPLTATTAEFYAHILAGLRARGTPIPTNDIWIAACAMEHGASPATSDRHFASVPGLLCLPLPA